MHWAALLSVGGAVCYALYIIATRMLSRTDSTETTLFYSNLVGAVVDGCRCCRSSGRRRTILARHRPDGRDRRLRLFGHYLLILAHRLAPASVLAPFMYTQLVWATRSAIWCSATCRTAGPWPARRSWSPPGSICCTASEGDRRAVAPIEPG